MPTIPPHGQPGFSARRLASGKDAVTQAMNAAPPALRACGSGFPRGAGPSRTFVSRTTVVLP